MDWTWIQMRALSRGLGWPAYRLAFGLAAAFRLTKYKTWLKKKACQPIGWPTQFLAAGPMLGGVILSNSYSKLEWNCEPRRQLRARTKIQADFKVWYSALHTLCYTVLHFVTLCYIVLHCVTLCYTMLYCVTIYNHRIKETIVNF